MELCVETRLGGHTERTKKDLLPYGWGVAFFTHFALKDRSWRFDSSQVRFHLFILSLCLCSFLFRLLLSCFLVDCSVLLVLFCFTSYLFCLCFSWFSVWALPWRLSRNTPLKIHIFQSPRFARYRKFGLGLTIEHLAGKISTFKSLFKT